MITIDIRIGKLSRAIQLEDSYPARRLSRLLNKGQCDRRRNVHNENVVFAKTGNISVPTVGMAMETATAILTAVD